MKNFSTYEGLQRGVPDTTAVRACHNDGLATDAISKGFGDFEGFGVVSKLGVCSGRHFEIEGSSCDVQARSLSRKLDKLLCAFQKVESRAIYMLYFLKSSSSFSSFLQSTNPRLATQSGNAPEVVGICGGVVPCPRYLRVPGFRISEPTLERSKVAVLTNKRFTTGCGIVPFSTVSISALYE